MRRILIRFGLVAATLLIGLVTSNRLTLNAAPTLYDWPQFGYNAEHTGSDSQETLISPANVATLKTLFQVKLPDTADGAPVLLTDIEVTGAAAAALSKIDTSGNPKHDLLFLTTRDGRILALDAHNGETVWSHQNPPGNCHINNGDATCYTTSSPAIDPNRKFVYSYGLDGAVHKYEVGSGTEVTGNGWPEVTTLKGYDEKGSSALAVATAHDGTTYLYMAQAGYPGDRGDYQGHLTTINLSSGAQKVFNTVCSDQAVHFKPSGSGTDCDTVQTALWARVDVVYDPETDRIYMATGNGTFDPSKHYWGDTVFALNPDGSGTGGDPVDTYTPANYQILQAADTDIGSTAPAILPVDATSSVKHLGVQSGKDGKLRLLNLDDLSDQHGIGQTGGELAITNVPQGRQVLTAPAVWVNPADKATWVFVANDEGISGLRLRFTNGKPGLQKAWQIAQGGTSPILANGLLFDAGSNVIQALDPLTGKTLWQDTSIGKVHWESPIIANGTLYISDSESHLTAYSLPRS